MNSKTGKMAEIKNEKGHISDVPWRLFFLFIIIISVIIFVGVHQQIGWDKLTELIIETEPIKQDSLKQEYLEKSLKDDFLQKFLENHNSDGEHSFDVAASLLSTVSIFLVIIGILLFREFDRLKEYHERVDQLLQSYKKQSEIDLDTIRTSNTAALAYSQATLATYVDQVTTKLIELEQKAANNQVLLDSVPQFEDVRFEAILYISSFLQEKNIIDQDTKLYIDILYYSNLLTPLHSRFHENALNQINQLLPKMKSSSILGKRLDEKFQQLILGSSKKSIINLIFKVQLTLHKYHPY